MSRVRLTRWVPAATLSLGLIAAGVISTVPVHADQAGPFADIELIDQDSEWRYLDDGSDPSDGLPLRTDWADPAFDDSTWPTGTGSFGANRGEQTELSGDFYPDNLLDQYYEGTTNKEAFFFRSSFIVEEGDLGPASALLGGVRYDDAAIVFINGERVDGFHDDGLPFTEEGTRRNMVFGGSNSSAPRLGEFQVSAEVLQPGTNTIAVQLHQGRANSSDIFFALEYLTLTQIEETRDGQTSILLGLGADPSERLLSWFTDTGVAESVQLTQGAVETMPDDALSIEPSLRGASADLGRDYVHATLSDLTPGVYSYRVGSDEGGWSSIEQFEVYAQNVEHEFTFVGDPQIGASGNRASDGEGWQRALDANDVLFPNSQFVLSSGDQVETYSGNVEEYQLYLAPRQMRTQPSVQTLGNHDYNSSRPQDLYHQHYNQPNLADYDPSRGSFWFIYNDVLHLNISTEYRNWAEHRAFLESIIDEHADDVQWTMLTFHRPLYSAGNHSVTSTTDQIRDGLGPIINDLPIDLVLTGHDHSYARSYLINSDGEQVDPEISETEAGERHVIVTPQEGETLFITANSSSGSKYYNVRDWSEWREGFQPRFTDQQRRQNITHVAVSQCTVTANTVELDGTTVDKVELLRDHAAPVITFDGDNTVEAGSAFDPLSGVTVTDDCADLTGDDLEITGDVDVDTLGDYVLTYRATDEVGNEVEVERTISVVAADDDDDDTTRPSLAVSGSLVAGGKVTVAGAGFEADDVVTVELHSEPAVLGSTTADADGAFTLEATIPADTVPGAHTLIAFVNGVEVVSLDVTIAAADGETGDEDSDGDNGGSGGNNNGGSGSNNGGSGGLPTTGAGIRSGVLAGLALLTLGGAFTLVNRRMQVR